MSAYDDEGITRASPRGFISLVLERLEASLRLPLQDAVRRELLSSTAATLLCTILSTLGNRCIVTDDDDDDSDTDADAGVENDGTGDDES